MDGLTSAVVPLLLAAAGVYALYNNVDVFPTFLTGAKEGLHTAVGILPTMVGMLTAGDVAEYDMRTITNPVLEDVPIFNILGVLEGELLNETAHVINAISGRVVIAQPLAIDQIPFKGENTVLICGQQPDIIRSAVASGVHCVVLCQAELPEDLRREDTDTCIISTPYDAYQTVRRIFQMMAGGHASEQIAKTLNLEAVPTPMLYKRAAGCSRSSWPSVRDENIWTRNLISKILRDERYIGTNVYGKRTRDQVGHHHTVKVTKAEWITASGTHDGIVTQDEFDKAQLAMREFVERDGINLGKWALRRKVRCGICGYTMTRSRAKHPVYYCRTNHVSDAFACPSERVPEADILEAVLDGLHVQAMAAVEMARIWEERHRREKLDTAALQKNIAALREAHGRLERQIKDLYTSFGLREISKAEYLAYKAAAIQQRDSTAERLAALEAKLENTSEDGELQNQFVARFRPHVEAEIVEITLEILSDILSEICVYPGRRLEIIWNYREEYENLMLDLEGEYQNGT